MTTNEEAFSRPAVQYLVQVPGGGRRTTTVVVATCGGSSSSNSCCKIQSYDDLLYSVVEKTAAAVRISSYAHDDDYDHHRRGDGGGNSKKRRQQQPSSRCRDDEEEEDGSPSEKTTTSPMNNEKKRRRLVSQNFYLVHRGKVLDDRSSIFFFPGTTTNKKTYVHDGTTAAGCGGAEEEEPDVLYYHLQLRGRILGGIDRQNRVGSKFGGGGVSSSQQSERERKERLKQLALESIDLAKDPYLVRNHLGSYECKLCLTLHRDEANYLAHTQGKKHQQGLARRAHLEKMKRERDGGIAQADLLPTTAICKPAPTAAANKVRIGRPAYQVFKSRDADTNQRCLSFELHFPEIEEDLQPRHRFMSAFEQRVESPPDRRYQYLLFAAEPYETVAFKIPNEPIDKGENRFVTNWDADGKKLTVTLYFMENQNINNNNSAKQDG